MAEQGSNDPEQRNAEVVVNSLVEPVLLDNVLSVRVWMSRSRKIRQPASEWKRRLIAGLRR